jgi:hypothetical protein
MRTVVAMSSGGSIVDGNGCCNVGAGCDGCNGADICAAGCGGLGVSGDEGCPARQDAAKHDRSIGDSMGAGEGANGGSGKVRLPASTRLPPTGCPWLRHRASPRQLNLQLSLSRARAGERRLELRDPSLPRSNRGECG